MWMEAKDPESRDYIVWFNGISVAPQLVGFEKLYSPGTAYWGTAAFLLAVKSASVVGVLEGASLEDSSPRAIVSFRSGIIVWERISDYQD